MKRIGIVSDSHGMRGMLEQSLIKLEAGGPLDALIHCGDGGSDAKYLAGNILQAVIVRGNCDGWGCDYEDDMVEGAQVACFGHTHKPFCEYRDGVLLINPGTCTLRGACALLTIDQSGSFQAELL